MLAAQLFQSIEELMNVRLCTDKGITDEVRMLNDELQRFQVFGSERPYINTRVGEIDSLFRPKSLPFGTCLCDFNGCEI